MKNSIKQTIQNKLLYIEERLMILDSLVMISEEEENYEFEYEYLRGKKDVLTELLELL